MLTLKETNWGDADRQWRFVRTMPENENGVVNTLCGISREEYVTCALPRILARAKGEDLQEDHVPETDFFLWADEEIVGQFRLRHYLNDVLRTGAGHIGYYIAPQYRGRGYATEGLRQTLILGSTIVPESEFYLRLQKDNTASLRVMEKNGGRIFSEEEGYIFVRIPKTDQRAQPPGRTPPER